mgnify:CR=1 FL=1
MEEKINIAEILKDKKNGLRLYSPIFGECAFCCVRKDTNDICVKKDNGVKEFFDSKGLYYNTGEVMLFPSKSMRDWEKLSWKRGDVLISDCGFVCIFKEWASDDYTRFNGCYFDGMPNAQTDNYSKLDNNTAYGYIRKLEKRCGGVLNIKTLKIEKQPEFKDGDILSNHSTSLPKNHIFIFSKFNKNKDFEYHVALTASGEITIPTSHCAWCNKDSGVKYATKEERQQLFDALAKEGKRWNSDKKAIVDLKPKWTPKPFDNVITRVHNKAIWTANIFSHIDQHGKYVTIGCISGYTYCLPYNDETAHLIGTTDEWKGGEHD